MPPITVSSTTLIPAPAFTVYDIIADYQGGHPHILPPEYFGRLDVEAGGRGAGTRIRFEMKAFGRVNVDHATVTEPVPGRELRETLDTGIVTTFHVEPVSAGETRATIHTTWQARGLRGLIESFLAPRYLAKVYAAELALLAREAVRRAGATA